jgi:hypothetical protein
VTQLTGWAALTIFTMRSHVMVGPTSSTRIVQEEVGANLAAKRALAKRQQRLGASDTFTALRIPDFRSTRDRVRQR